MRAVYRSKYTFIYIFNVFRITVFDFYGVFFFNVSSMDCMSRMSRWLAFYTHLTLTVQHTFWQILCHRRSINVVKQARHVIVAFNL